MSGTGGGKIRNRKDRTSEKPYGRRTSILNRVTDTVKDILSPSWLLDMMSSVRKRSPPTPTPDDDQAQGRQPTKSSLELEESYLPPPVALQMRYSYNSTEAKRPSFQPPPLDRFTPARGELSTNRYIPPRADTTYVATSTQLPFTTYRSERVTFREPLVNGDDGSSEFSQTGSTAVVPDRQDYQKEILQLKDTQIQKLREELHVPPVRESPLTVKEKDDDSIASGSSSRLWSAEKPASKPQTSARSQKPSFSISAFGSPLLSNNSILGESPYYPGKTTFGGASAHRRTRLKTTAPYQTVAPVRRQVKAKPMNNTYLGGVTSSTARRILETLERMSTPLSDAKKIPSNSMSTTDSPMSFTPGGYRNKRRVLNSSVRNQLEGPPINTLTTPRAASIAVNRQKMSAPVVQSPAQEQVKKAVEKPAEKIIPEKQKSINEPDRGPMKHSGKMRREKKSQHYAVSREEEEEVEAPDLPTGFTLPVTNLPTFKFGASTTSSFGTTAPSIITSTPAIPPKPPVNKMPGSPVNFSFASPIEKVESENVGSLSPTKSGYTFSSPIKITNSSTLPPVSTSTTSASAPMQMNFSNSSIITKPTPRRKLRDDEQSPTKESPSGGFQPAKELKTGSVMDILGKADEKGTGFTAKPAAELKTGSVMDILGKGPVTTQTTKEINENQSKPLFGKSPITSGFGDKFKKPAGSWQCDTCLVHNKAEDTKCVACTTPKPGSSSSSVPTTQSGVPMGGTFSGFGDKFKAEEGSWKCGTCLVKNKAKDSKCVACQTPNPKAAVASTTTNTTAPPASASGFGNLFKQPEGSWKCDTCLITNKPESTKCVACETPNPKASANTTQAPPTSGSGFGNLFKQPEGSWKCDTCLITNKPESTKCVACETPNPKASANTTKAPAPVSSGFGDMFKKPAGSWKCDVCLVTNKPEITKCAACETPKPGTQATGGFGSSFAFGSSGQSGSGTFKFGSTTTEAPSSGFTFGAKAGADDKKNETSSGSGFKFGSSNTSTSDTSTGTGFQFGSSGAGKSESTVGTGFQFGASNKSENDNIKNTDTKPSGFKFGQPVTSKTETKPEGFSFGNSDVPKTEQKQETGGFKLAQTETNTLNDKPPIGSGGFSFGVSKTADSSIDNKATTGFQFGSVGATSSVTTAASAAATTSTTVAGGFSFGSAIKKAEENKSIGLAAPATNTTFGSLAAPSTDQPKPASTGFGGFTFGATAKADNSSTATVKPGGFSFMSTPAQTQPVNEKKSPRKHTLDDDDAPGGKKPAFSFTTDSVKPSLPSTTVKFGETTQTTASSNLFTFGQPSNTAAKVGVGTDVCGTGSTATPASGFAFGSATPAFGASNTTSTTPVFGSGALETTTPSFGTTTSAPSFGTTTSAPAFGTTISAPAFGTTTTTSSSVFAFGATNNTPTPAFGGFGTASTSSTPAFGSQGSTAFGTAGSTNAFGSGFGQSTAGTGTTAFSSTPNFNFGGTTSTTEKSATGGLFQFGAKPSEPVANTGPLGAGALGAGATPSNTAFQFSAGTTPNFNFGAGSTAPAFTGFSASPAAGSNPFNAAPAAATGQRRVIKRAQRKLRK